MTFFFFHAIDFIMLPKRLRTHYVQTMFSIEKRNIPFSFYNQSREQYFMFLVPFHTSSFLVYNRLLILPPHQGVLPPSSLTVTQCRCTPSGEGGSQTCTLSLRSSSPPPFTVKALYLCLREQLDAAAKHPHSLSLTSLCIFQLFKCMNFICAA